MPAVILSEADNFVGSFMATIGQTLGDARRDRGLSIEDAGHHTRIHPNMIRDIEEDDFSIFPSVAYAKSFVRNYSEYLEVDVSEALQALNSGVAVRLSENELMGEMKKTIKKDRIFRLERGPKRIRRNVVKRGKAPVLLNLVLGVLILAMAIFYLLGYNADTAEEARADITNGIKKATPFMEPDDSLPPHPFAVGSQQEEPFEGVRASPEAEQNSVNGPPVQLPVADLARTESDEVEAIIEKPEVEWEVEEERPSPFADSEHEIAEALKPRDTPNLPLETNLSATPMKSSDLPVMRQLIDEPTATLRPPGTNPKKLPRQNSRELKPAGTADTGEGSAPLPLRAVPVVVRERS